MFSLFAHHAEAFLKVEINGRDYPDGMTEHVIFYALGVSALILHELRHLRRTPGLPPVEARPRRGESLIEWAGGAGLTREPPARILIPVTSGKRPTCSSGCSSWC